MVCEMAKKDYTSVNVPTVLLETLENLIEKTNNLGYTYIPNKSEGVRRAVEHFIKLLDTFIETKSREIKE